MADGKPHRIKSSSVWKSSTFKSPVAVLLHKEIQNYLQVKGEAFPYTNVTLNFGQNCGRRTRHTRQTSPSEWPAVTETSILLTCVFQSAWSCMQCADREFGVRSNTQCNQWRRKIRGFLQTLFIQTASSFRLNTSCYANELPAAVENLFTRVKPDESVTRKLSRPLSHLNALWWGFCWPEQ